MIKYDFRISWSYFRKINAQEFVKFSCNEIENNLFAEIAGLYIGGKVYKLDNVARSIDHFGCLDDVAILGLTRCRNYAACSEFAGKPLVDYPVGKTIKGIKWVDERQQISEDGEVTFELRYTKAIIFRFDDEELMFEKQSSPFSKDIIISRGHNLIETVAPETEFFESIIDGLPEGVTPECTLECNYMP